jgi:three-Cys-motif partner protein
MSAPGETIWRIEPHTAAKHRILKEWWNAWLPKLGITHKRVIYFDGFAGPGTYLDGEPGSPIVALQAALNHSRRPKFESTEVIFYLVEKRKDRKERLEAEISRRFPEIPPSWKVTVVQGTFAEELEPVLDDLEEKGAGLAPTFAFLDPFGFKGLPMDLVSRLLAYRWCDVLITFMERDINRFASSPFHIDAIDRCLGNRTWRRNVPDGPEERRTFFLKTYEEEVRKRVPDAHVRSFEMSSSGGPIYYLVGATKHKEGVKVMKRAMWVTDPTGNYRFSDRTAGTRTLLEWEDEPAWGSAAAREVYRKFARKRVPVREVEDFVLYETPYEFKKRPILGRLESDGYIIEVAGRGRSGWPSGCTLVFR